MKTQTHFNATENLQGCKLRPAQFLDNKKIEFKMKTLNVSSYTEGTGRYSVTFIPVELRTLFDCWKELNT